MAGMLSLILAIECWQSVNYENSSQISRMCTTVHTFHYTNALCIPVHYNVWLGCCQYMQPACTQTSPTHR